MRLLLTILLISFAGDCFAPSYLPHRRKAFRVVAGGASFSDNFDRANNDSLGANWTEAAGDQDITSNQLGAMTTGFAKNLAIYSGTSCNTVNQYAKIKIVAGIAGFIHLVFRYTDSSSAYYAVEVENDGDSNCRWYYYPTAAGSGTEIAATTFTGGANGDTFGITLTGTGTSTEVRMWRNPTGAAPDSAISWGGDTTPDSSFTTDPPTPVNTGSKVGLQAFHNSANTLDDFSGGDIP